MQNSEIVKKRLSELKKLSQNLKQTTELKSDLDVSLIKAILSITKSNNANNNSNKSHGFSIQGINSQSNLSLSAHNNQLQSPNTMKSLSASLLQKFVSKSSIIDENKNQQQIQPLFEQTSRSGKQQPQNKKSLNKNNSYHTSQSNNSQSQGKLDTEELIHLREENVKMELQIRQLKQKLVQYKSRQQQQRHQKIRQKQKKQEYSDDEGVGHSPYFRLNQQTQLFLTQITVNKADYSKIQYTPYPLKLSLDRLTIKKQKKLNSSSRSKLHQQQYSFIPLDIARIVDVTYIQDNRMLIMFKNNMVNQQSYTYLYLQFDAPETLHRWDLAIYINYKIITCLNHQQIFTQQFVKKPQQVQQKVQNIVENTQEKVEGPPVQPVRQSQQDLFSQNHKQQQKQFLKIYLQNKRKYIQSQKNLKQDMLKKINSIKNSQKASNQQQLRPLSFNGKNLPQKIDVKIQQPLQRISKQEQKQKQIPKQINRTQPQPEIKKQQPPKQITKPQSNRTSQKQQIHPQKIVQQLESMFMSQKQQQDNKKKIQQKKKISDAINLLKSGRLMMKYSKSAFNPHEKRVFVSQDNTRLCWQDKDSNQFKYIYITDIQSVNKGELGPGVKKHLQGKKISNPNCYVTIHTKIKDRKTLQFGIKNSTLMDQFIDCLLILIGQLRKGRL